MIQDVGNIELCELLEMEPKTQCTTCLSYWNIGIIYCTCGHFLHKERGASQELISFSMDFLSILSTSSRKEDFMDIDMVKISSVFTEQSRKCVKNMIPFTMDQGDLIWWWDNEVCSVRSRQKFLCIVVTQRIKIFYCINMKNELESCHNKINWVNFVWMQDLCVLLKLDSISWLRTLDFFDAIQYSGLSWVHSSKGRWIITTERMDPGRHKNWTRIGSCN